MLGAGAIGQVHAQAYATIPGVQVAAVVGLGAERATPAGQEAIVGLDAILRDPTVEVVDICLPTALHPQAVIAAARAGKDIICEKPLALTLAESEAMIAACDEAGVRLLPAMVVRFFPQYVSLAQLLRSGQIGVPVTCTLRRQGFYPFGADGWYRDPRRSGGIFLDLMIHDFDWALWQFGAAQRVFARLAHGPEERPFSQGSATVRHTSGVLTQITGTWGHPGPFTTAVELSGTEGLLQYDSRDSEALQVMAPVSGDSVDVPLPNLETSENPYRTELAHFLEVIAGQVEPRVSAEESLAALRLALAASESVATGRAVSMVPEAAS